MINHYENTYGDCGCVCMYVGLNGGDFIFLSGASRNGGSGGSGVSFGGGGMMVVIGVTEVIVMVLVKVIVGAFVA